MRFVQLFLGRLTFSLSMQEIAYLSSAGPEAGLQFSPTWRTPSVGRDESIGI